jgi:hypothetical protein
VRLHSSSLFNVGNAPGRGTLVETDPRFANYRVWASSAVLLAQLGAQTTLRRLGDSYYEQRLVTEQIMAPPASVMLATIATAKRSTWRCSTPAPSSPERTA